MANIFGKKQARDSEAPGIFICGAIAQEAGAEAPVGSRVEASVGGLGVPPKLKQSADIVYRF